MGFIRVTLQTKEIQLAKKMFAMLIRKLILPNIMFDDCWCNNQFIKHYYIRQMPLGGYYYRYHSL